MDESTAVLLKQLTSQGTMSIVIVAMLEWAKNSPLAPFINKETTALNKGLGAFLAFITSIGIAYTYSAGVVTITFTVMTVLHGLWTFIQQLAFQHIVYHGFIKPKTVEVSAAAPAAVAINPPVQELKAKEVKD
jgi:hypothetical protein